LNETINRHEKSKRENELTLSVQEYALLDNIYAAMPGLCSILECTAKNIDEALQFEAQEHLNISVAVPFSNSGETTIRNVLEYYGYYESDFFNAGHRFEK
jgi:hypothetical protein